MPELYPHPPISVNAAAKKYGIPQTTLARWTRQGRIKTLVHPERHGQKMLVDEASVALAAQQRRRYYLKLAEPIQYQQPTRFCPYCGRPMPNQEEPDTR